MKKIELDEFQSNLVWLAISEYIDSLKETVKVNKMYSYTDFEIQELEKVKLLLDTPSV